MSEVYDEKAPSNDAPVGNDASKAFVDPEKAEPAAAPLAMRHGIPLLPQPTSDRLDPLTWSSWRKHGMLAIVMALYFMFTYITTTTVPSFPELQTKYNLTVDQVNWTVAIPALGLAVGPLVWSSPADIIGRRIIFIVGTLVALGATIGAALAPSYGGYMAARFFQGFGVSPAATVGLAIINDLFFEHERGQKIGFWVLAIDVGLFVGPLFGGFMDIVSAKWIQWLTAIFFGAILFAEVGFLPETLYPRNLMLERMPYNHGHEKHIADDAEKAHDSPQYSDAGLVKRTKKLPFISVTPVPGLKHPQPWASLINFGRLFKFAVVPMSVFVFCFGWYWFVLCIITMIPVAYADYKPQIQGLFFLGLILGTVFTEIFCSGRLSDWIVDRLAARNANVRVAEMRLWLAYPGALLSAIGLIIWGISIDRHWHWITGQIAFFLFAAGIQMGNTAVCSYIVDAYPLQSMAVITFYSVCLNLSAFISPFFISPWVSSVGFTWAFATQGILTFFFCVPALAALHYYGAAIRQKCGQPNWVNPEYDSL